MSSANIGVYDPTNLTSSGFSNIGPIKAYGTASFEAGACLAPDGNVVLIPYAANNAIAFNTTSFLTSNILVYLGGSGKFIGSTLLPSGNIVFCPNNSGNVGLLNPFTLTYSNSSLKTSTGGFAGCTLLPDGRVVFCPSTATNVGIYDTFTPSPVELCLSPYFNKL